MELRVLFFNTFLLRPVNIPLSGKMLKLGPPPGWRERARDMGPRLRGRADVLALAEVWEWRDRDTLLDAWPADERPAVAEGPGAGPVRIRGAGLRTFVDGLPIARTATTIFRTRGNPLVDADALANKGVLLTSVLLPDATELEIYSTHLCWGGGILPTKLNPAGMRADVRAAQIAELAEFVRATHEPGSPMLVVGDFNIAAVTPDGQRTDEHRNLLATMTSLGLEDQWLALGNAGPGYTCNLLLYRDQLGSVDAADPDLLVDEEAADDDGRVLAPTGWGPVRIDYAFFAPGSAGPGLRPTSLRRASFPRHDHEPNEADPLRTLSDHCGLLLTLAD